MAEIEWMTNDDFGLGVLDLRPEPGWTEPERALAEYPTWLVTEAPYSRAPANVEELGRLMSESAVLLVIGGNPMEAAHAASGLSRSHSLVYKIELAGRFRHRELPRQFNTEELPVEEPVEKDGPWND